MHDIGLVIEGSDAFFRPIEARLREQYRVDRFAPRFIRAPLIGSSVNKLLLELQFSRFLRSHDVVFFEWAGTLLIKASHMPKLTRIVTRLHSIEMATAAHLVDWRGIAAVIVLSEHMKRRLQSVANATPATLRVIGAGIDTQRFCPGARQFQYRIGMACRVVPIKRVYEAILCLSELRRQGYPFTLDVAGALGDEGDEKRYSWATVSLIEKLGLSDAVTLRGFVADIARWYHDIDVFLSNSFWEGQQNALLEAMASGCYCLSHCWGGAEEILPAEYLFDSDAVLRAKLMHYAELPDADRCQAGVQVRTIVEERFEARRMVNAVVGLVADVMRT
jgi:glycosyltransferase involved in cell wall biosynthesis